MNRKIIAFGLMTALIMVININVNASYTCETSTCPTCVKNSDAPEGTTCTNKSNCDTNCHSGTPYNCGCKDSSSKPDCEFTNGSCSCKTPSSPTLSDGCSGTYSQNGEGCKMSLSGATEYKCSSSHGNLASVDDNGNVTVVGTPKTANCKQNVTISCKAVNGCGKESTTSSTGDILIMTPWPKTGTDETVGNPDLLKYTMEYSEEHGINVAYECAGGGDVPVTCKKYSRGGCGSNPPEPNPYCYEDTNTGFLYWDYNYKTDRTYQRYVDGTWVANSPYKYRKDIGSAKACKTQFGCTLPTYPKDKKVTAECNTTSTISSSDQNYHKHCGVKAGSTVDQRIYTIDCEETMKTAFNGPVWDNKNSFMYAGTGFGFNYQVKTKVECEGKWHADFYALALKYTTDYLDKHGHTEGVSQDGVNDVADSHWYASAKTGMEDIKKSYQNWSLKSIYFSASKVAANGEIADDQSQVSTSEGRTKDEYKEKLELETEYNSTQPTSECYSKTSSGAPTQSVPQDFTYKVAYTFNFRLPLLYYKPNGGYTTEDCTNCGKLGRIFPISENDDYAGNSKYVYKVDINNLGMNHNWSNNEVCSISMKKKDIVFRQINLTDPFIQKLANSDHKIGRNWQNNKYDFTDVIDPSIWSKNSQYNTITIDQETGKLIKAELSTNTNSYLGACSKGTATGQTPTICSLYKQAKK